MEWQFMKVLGGLDYDIKRHKISDKSLELLKENTKRQSQNLPGSC